MLIGISLCPRPFRPNEADSKRTQADSLDFNDLFTWDLLHSVAKPILSGSTPVARGSGYTDAHTSSDEQPRLRRENKQLHVERGKASKAVDWFKWISG